ncbi:MAG TPA: ABC transporter substrate-binding protein [Stellaceae bacterium]|nr:ABC transporter substrate-binding protein [Stellaceae bacterium]
MAHYRMLFLATAAALLAHQALAQDAQVMHWWTSGGESRAVAVFAKEYAKRGGKWIDGASVGPQAEHAAVLNAIAGGNPPAAFQWNIGVAVRQLAEQGLLANLDDTASAGEWNRHLPPLLVKNITVDGHVIAVPVNLHGANWMFYSTKVFSDLSMAPPKTWDEFLAQADKIKASGYLPIAMGGNAQQTGWLFYATLAGVGGKEVYRKIFVDHDATAAGSEEVRHAFETMGKIRQYADAGGSNRKWNDTLALVETNKAAFMIAGDWAKGDFSAAGMTPGKEYGCLLAPGTQDAYVMTVDVFAFPKVNKPDQVAAQRKLAELMMDPAVQVEFNKFKGSLPARLDADVGSLDACAQIGQKVMAGGDSNQLPNFALAFGPDTQGQIEDLLIHYWSTPGMSAADATKEFSTIIANAAS